MNRRDFLKYAAVGAAAITIDGCIPQSMRQQPTHHSHRLSTLTLNISEALVEMVDGTAVYMWLFENPAKGPRFPGPTISAQERDTVTLSVTNTLDEDHSFIIPGVVDSGPLTPGESKMLTFTAPAAGTYLYFDSLNAPVNRNLGLHGAMVILPHDLSTNPYTDPTPAVRDLFNDLGNSAHFPGEPWIPERSTVWLFSSVDPKFNQMAMVGNAIDPEKFINGYLPRYFTINGESGAFASHNHKTVPSGRIGQPHLIRIVNADVNVHSPHIHGNHVYVTAINGQSREDAHMVDTYSVFPMDRVDWLLPFMRPPDIPGDPNVPLRELIRNEMGMVLGGVPQAPLAYPMHGHDELSQTAAGGNYPQGMVTHWEITGDLDGVDFPSGH
ncbi:MAG: multicopper oxidase domain-containing protein [Nitrospirae bacterium]|nr:multicopper oxidase domain-containing protein [Nitrospirota bacterium]